jgi:DNA end-binding protein Ku
LLNTLAWPTEIRDAGSLELPDLEEVAPAEERLAIQLLDAMTEPFDPAAHGDSYALALDAMIEAKVAGSEFVDTSPEPSPILVDLMAALERSVAEATAARAFVPSERSTRSTAKRKRQIGKTAA